MPTNLPLLIVQMGTPPDDLRELLGEQSAWFAAALGTQAQDLRIVRPYLQEELPDESEFSAAIITGSWSMVTTKEDWSVRTGTWAKGLILAGKPLLGVCYGHQLMADVMGGVVDYLPAGRELGTLPVTLNERGRADPFLHFLPNKFHAHLTHEQAVLVPPPGAENLASSAQDTYQILRYGPHALSVQFHPEFGVDILRACVAKRAVTLAVEGRDVGELTSNIVETPFATQILVEFAKLPQHLPSPLPTRPVAAAIAAVIRGGEVLLVRRAHPPNAGKWALPGGKIEFGESIEAAAVRELFEETHVRAEARQVLTAVDVFDKSEDGTLRQHFILIVVLCRWVSGEPQGDDDASDARWFPVAEITSSGLVMTAGLEQVVQQAAALAAT